ncbi:MAG: UDP-N-acetylglucosamine 2-epimerase (non-hydrolyzing) [Planctomycetota bacterium]
MKQDNPGVKHGDSDPHGDPLRPLIIVGTRPEAIKMAPVILQAKAHRWVQPIVCRTGQHREMLDQVLGYFEIQPDVELDVMTPGQSLSKLSAKLIDAIDDVIGAHHPDAVVVQGDTTSVMAASMVAFFHRLPIVHVEAGLRTGDLAAPWPEEFNRRVAGMISTLHCAPTVRSADALRREGIPDADIQVTGNTVIDALLDAVDRERADPEKHLQTFPMFAPTALSSGGTAVPTATGGRVLITGHRRENFGDGMIRLCRAIERLSKQHPDVSFLYPVHLNPKVQQPVHERLGPLPNVHLVPPANYAEFVWLMDQADVVVTDSGGVQEEAPSLGATVLVTRDKTERPEAVEAGLAELVGTDEDKIVDRVTAALRKRQTPSSDTRRQAVVNNPYGDGQAAKRIVNWMVERLLTPSKPFDARDILGECSIEN